MTAFKCRNSKKIMQELLFHSETVFLLSNILATIIPGFSVIILQQID